MGNEGQNPTGWFASYRRLRYQISGSKKLRVPLLWLRHRGLRSSDVILGSYPRSGCTWLRFNLFEILTGQPATFQSVNRGLRGPGSHYRGLPLLPDKGRFLSIHEPYRADYKKIVYLVRDVRDVVSSEFWYEKERGFGCSDFDEYLLRMLQGQKMYGSWQDHVASWIHSEAAIKKNLLLIRYENMRRNPELVLSELVQFLGLPVDSESIRKAVANNALQEMRAKEDVHKSNPKKVRFPERPEGPSREEGRFIRQGKVGGWREQLSDSQVRLIERYAGSTLVELGYTLSSPPILDSALTAHGPRS
jgi:hypothetical protein